MLDTLQGFEFQTETNSLLPQNSYFSITATPFRKLNPVALQSFVCFFFIKPFGLRFEYGTYGTAIYILYSFLSLELSKNFETPVSYVSANCNSANHLKQALGVILPRITSNFFQQPKTTQPPTCAVLWFYLAKYHFSSKSQLSSRAVLLPRSACFAALEQGQEQLESHFQLPHQTTLCHAQHCKIPSQSFRFFESHSIQVLQMLRVNSRVASQAAESKVKDRSQDFPVSAICSLLLIDRCPSIVPLAAPDWSERSNSGKYKSLIGASCGLHRFNSGVLALCRIYLCTVKKQT